MNLYPRITRIAFLMGLLCSAPLPQASAADRVAPADLPRHAVEESQITLPGSPPFHFRARVVEATNRKNDSYNAEIEEYWVAPDKWRRTVKSADFSQTLILNGQKTTEQLTG